MRPKLSSRLRGLLGQRRECNKLIEYHGNNYVLSASAGVPPISISLQELSRKPVKLAEATNHAKVLDDYQFMMCSEIRNRDPKDRDTKLLANYMVVMMGYVTEIGSLVEQILVKGSSKALEAELVKCDKKAVGLIDQMRKDLLRPRLAAPTFYMAPRAGASPRLPAPPSQALKKRPAREANPINLYNSFGLNLSYNTKKNLKSSLPKHSEFLGLSEGVVSKLSSTALSLD